MNVSLRPEKPIEPCVEFHYYRSDATIVSAYCFNSFEIGYRVCATMWSDTPGAMTADNGSTGSADVCITARAGAEARMGSRSGLKLAYKWIFN